MARTAVTSFIAALVALFAANWLAKSDCDARYHQTYIDHLYERLN